MLLACHTIICKYEFKQRNHIKAQYNTCLSPGTSPTAVPSARTQMISGVGCPLAWHSTTAPVPFEKSTRFGGSLTNTGPIDSSSAKTTANKRCKDFSYKCLYIATHFKSNIYNSKTL